MIVAVEETPILLTLAEAASIARVHPRTALRWVDDGVLPAVIIGVGTRRTIRVRTVDLNNLLTPVGANITAAAAELEQWLAGNHEQWAEMCPRCATNRVDPTSPTGWCQACADEAAAAKRAAAEREKERQRNWWAQNGLPWKAHNRNHKTEPDPDCKYCAARAAEQTA